MATFMVFGQQALQPGRLRTTVVWQLYGDGLVATRWLGLGFLFTVGIAVGAGAVLAIDRAVDQLRVEVLAASEVEQHVFAQLDGLAAVTAAKVGFAHIVAFFQNGIAAASWACSVISFLQLKAWLSRAASLSGAPAERLVLMWISSCCSALNPISSSKSG